MVLWGLDDVSEIVMREGACACQPQPGCSEPPSPAPASWLLDPRPGVGESGSDGCSEDLQSCSVEPPPTAAQTAVPGLCLCLQPDWLQPTAGGGAREAVGGAKETETRMSGTSAIWCSVTFTLEERVLDCLNAVMIAAAKNVPVYWIFLTEPSIMWNKKKASGLIFDLWQKSNCNKFHAIAPLFFAHKILVRCINYKIWVPF